MHGDGVCKEIANIIANCDLHQLGKLAQSVKSDNHELHDGSYPTLLYIASRAGANPKDIQRLIEADPESIFKSNTYGYTPLHSACKHGQKEVVETMLKLDSATSNTIPNVVKIVAKLIDIKTNIGSYSPLAVAIEHKEMETAAVILEAVHSHGEKSKKLHHRIVLVAGAGAVKAAEPTKGIMHMKPLTGWVDLLRFCLLRLQGLGDAEASTFLPLLEHPTSVTTATLLSVACYIDQKEGLNREVLADLCEGARIQKRALLDALRHIIKACNGAAMFATTNYDHLYADVYVDDGEQSDAEKITPADYKLVDEFLKGDHNNRCFHIHGEYTRPKTIIFSPIPYNHQANDLRHLAQMLLLLHLHCCVFIGVSAEGFDDPHMGKVFQMYNETKLKPKLGKHLIFLKDDKRKQFEERCPYNWLDIKTYSDHKALPKTLKTEIVGIYDKLKAGLLNLHVP